MVRAMMNSTRRPKWGELSASMKEIGFDRSVNSLMARRRYLQESPPEFKCVHNLVKSAIRNVIRLRKGAAYRSDWQKNHREQRRKSSKKSRDSLKDKPGRKEERAAKEKRGRKKASARELARYHSDSKFNSIKKARMRLTNYLAVKGLSKKSKTLELICMTAREFRDHLKRQRPELNHSDREIDHIFPLKGHELDTVDSQKQAMHFSNLQPLTAEENGWKSDKLPTKAMAAKVERWAWPPDVTEDMLPDIYDGWATPLRM